MESDWKSTLINTSVILGVLLGGSVLLMMYIINLFKNTDEEVPPKKNEKGTTEQSERKRETAHGAKSKKKTVDSRWGGRTDKQGFTHPWLLTSLKGHTGQVLDMDFSSNGKYLASCAEEDIDPGGDPNGDGGTSSGSDGNKENSRPSSADDPSPQTKGLSRRQRKNRRRDDASPSDTKKKVKPKRPEPTVKKPVIVVPLKQWLKLKLLERDLVTFLRSYLLSPEQMLTMGYPVESSLLPGRAIIFKSPISVPAYNPSHYRLSKFDVNRSRFDVNAQEFVPSTSVAFKDTDSGQGSGSSSDSGENPDDSESTTSSGSTDGSSTAPKRVTKFNAPDRHLVPERSVIRPRVDGSIGHTCVRCGANFYTKNNEYVTNENCTYHWGKLQSVIAPGSGKHHRTYGFAYEYSCCHSNQNTKGCTVGRAHVWSGLNVGFNGPYDSYTRTRPRKTPPHDGNYGVYALDCEMCFTVKGLELTKITVVGADGRLVYDSFVKPDNEIIDYNTRFSGITAKDLGKKSVTKTLREVQNDLMGFINADTILIGHGLENDLRALRIIHNTVVDTAVCFPHYNGLPYRRSLKSLTACFLKSDIQTGGASGHNSYEDARACMELMLWRVRKDFRGILEHVQ